MCRRAKFENGVLRNGQHLRYARKTSHGLKMLSIFGPARLDKQQFCAKNTAIYC